MLVFLSRDCGFLVTTGHIHRTAWQYWKSDSPLSTPLYVLGVVCLTTSVKELCQACETSEHCVWLGEWADSLNAGTYCLLLIVKVCLLLARADSVFRQTLPDNFTSIFTFCFL